MREIKFRRPYVRPNGVFSHFSYWGRNLGNTAFATPGSCNFADAKEDEQFTDYRDDFDTEVYEHDIIQTPYGIGKVVFLHSCFMIQWIDDPEANMELLSRTSKNKTRDSLKIIGNIHQHPELITNAIKG